MSKLWEDIKRISDELELQVHLASMEARDRWQALKPRVQELQTKIEDHTAAASARVSEELEHVGKLIRDLRDDVLARAK
ncbi:MAG TPA: hypothetical protein VK427_07190 [Kofleriaceae bacterium]|nr:hypothetical protein [Kofleriaceae bacterium]